MKAFIHDISPDFLFDTVKILSNKIAIMTITKPDSNPLTILTVFNACTTGFPRPSAPTKAAMTTIDKESMTHCEIPVIMDAFAKGISIVQSRFHQLAPNESATSKSEEGTLLTPK